MVVCILDFLVHRKYGTGTVYGYTLTLLLDEKFVDFKNVQLILVKSSPKKSFAQKTIFLGLFLQIYHLKYSNSL